MISASKTIFHCRNSKGVGPMATTAFVNEPSSCTNALTPAAVHSQKVSEYTEVQVWHVERRFMPYYVLYLSTSSSQANEQPLGPVTTLDKQKKN